MLLIIYRGWLADVYVIILFCIQKKKSNSNGVSFSFFFEREKFVKRTCFKQTRFAFRPGGSAAGWHYGMFSGCVCNLRGILSMGF